MTNDLTVFSTIASMDYSFRQITSGRLVTTIHASTSSSTVVNKWLASFGGKDSLHKTWRQSDFKLYLCVYTANNAAKGSRSIRSFPPTKSLYTVSLEGLQYSVFLKIWTWQSTAFFPFLKLYFFSNLVLFTYRVAKNLLQGYIFKKNIYVKAIN